MIILDELPLVKKLCLNHSETNLIQRQITVLLCYPPPSAKGSFPTRTHIKRIETIPASLSKAVISRVYRLKPVSKRRVNYGPANKVCPRITVIGTNVNLIIKHAESN